MKILGIDPGITGAAFYLDTDSQEYAIHRFDKLDDKLDISSFAHFLSAYTPELVVIEKIFLAGREGGRSAMTIGSNYGRITATLDLIGASYTEVTPRVWQKALGLKSGSRAIVKESAKQLAVQRFGESAFLFGRSTKPHDGATDAACIAFFGIHFITESLWNEKQSTKSTQTYASSTGTSAKKSSTLKAKNKKSSKSGMTNSRKSKKATSKQDSRSAKSSGKSKLAG